ncbi:hypothetical protein AAFF_G00383550 [Aldrovandia affinis]|uniref:NudC domain-containing protein 1 n=1 Tax=Aldrovandia affinis TaxID=143900 RepID=A0AAD7SHA3_9TELE|nr:hypothetical protein AAFF_G00383550 [Aldrovandia affinis]
MAASNCSLKINRQLLDPNFESYRLSLDPLPTYNIELDAAVAEVTLKDNQYTLDHIRAIGMYNYLQIDPWYEDSVYFTDCMGEENKYEVRKRRVLQGKCVPHYAALEPQGLGLMVASEKPFRPTHVDGEPLAQSASVAMAPVGKTDLIYFWKQTAEDITVTVHLPDDTTKEDIQFKLCEDSLSVGIQGYTPLIEGHLHALVDPTASTWISKDSKILEVFLQKDSVGHMWPELVIGDGREESVLSQNLTDVTAEDMIDNPEKDKASCNAQELEDCDIFPEDGSSLMRFDGETMEPTHVVNLGSHQFLFAVDVNPSEMPCFCLRHDVDALLWQPRPTQPDSMWEHIATFNALGYVQASKHDKKFSTCAPNFSYAALGECLRRVYIYRQPSPVDTLLFNRKQGRQVEQVAKQQVASLDSSDIVLGFRATNERLFVLTSKNLLVLRRGFPRKQTTTGHQSQQVSPPVSHALLFRQLLLC